MSQVPPKSESCSPTPRLSSLEICRLFTRNLEIKRIEQNDLPTLVEWSNSMDANGAYLSMEQGSIDQYRQRFDSAFFWNTDSKTYLVVLKENQLRIGTIQYWRKHGKTSTACITIRIAVPHLRNHGYGTEVQKCLIRHLIQTGDYLAVEMHTDINNIGQQRCLVKLGFELISSETFTDYGHSRMGNLYRLTKDQFQSSPEFVYYYD